MHLISLNLVHPVDSGVDKSECQLLGFYKAKTHKVIQEYKSVLKNCHLPCHYLLMGRQGGCAQRGRGGEASKGGGSPPSSEVPGRGVGRTAHQPAPREARERRPVV